VVPRIVVSVTILLAAVALGASPASAADLTLPAGTVIEAAEGSLVELGRVPVDTDRAGPRCTWEASVTNQESVHPGNDILVVSGDSTLVLSDIEASAGKVTSNSGSVYLVDEVVVLLRMGPDEIFSGGLDLTIRYDSCQPEPPTTPSTAPEPEGPVTVDVTTSTVAPGVAVTTAPPPAGPTTLPVSGPSSLVLTIGVGLGLIAAGALATKVVRSRA
jgi:hypothetical protein